MSSTEDSDASLEPEEFSDPITLSLMEEAMMAAGCGHSFSRDSITTWLRQNHPSCPVCKRSLTEAQLVPNYALRSAIERYQRKRGRGRTVDQSDSAHTTSHYGHYDMPPDPVKPPPMYTGAASSSSAESPGIDAEADAPPPAGAAGGRDLEEGCCCGCLDGVTHKAREAPQGCCTFTCEGPVYCCATAHGCERSANKCNEGFVTYPWYKSPSGLTCVYLYGTDSTYTRRTYASLCFPLLALVLSVVYLCEFVFLGVFWTLAFFVISPIWLLVRMPITMLCPLYYDDHIKGKCWDNTFNCS